MFCKSCGQQMDDFALACPKCGAASTTQAPPPPPPTQQYQPPAYQPPQYQAPQYQAPVYQQPYQAQPVADVPSGGMKLLSFCIPLVGLILYLTWKDQKPISAKAMGKAALIGFIVSFVLSIAYYIIVFVVIGASSSYNYSSYYSIATNFAAKYFG